MSITKRAIDTAMSIGFAELYGSTKKVPKKELSVHLSHCNQGEWDVNCPVLKKGSNRNCNMIEYTREEALLFYNMLCGGVKEGDNSKDTMSPKDIILRALETHYMFHSDIIRSRAQVNDIHGELLFSEPIENMPLYINESYIEKEIAKWRLSIAK